jgi:hypothetical protein
MKNMNQQKDFCDLTVAKKGFSNAMHIRWAGELCRQEYSGNLKHLMANIRVYNEVEQNGI